MIRFVDIRGQGIGSRFSFYDTIESDYINIDNCVAWDNWDQFLEWAEGEYIDFDRFKKLCPVWVFDGGEDDIDAFWAAG